MEQHDDFYADGAWQRSAATDRIEVLNPATEQVAGTVPAGGAADVDVAVAAAAKAAPGWAASTPAERAAALTKLRDGLIARTEDIARTVATELGAPLPIATAVHAGLPVAVTDSYITLLADFPFREEVGNSVVHAEPIGVVGAITPWNYPLHQAVAKVAAALAAGCTIVLKPAEDTPLVAYLLAGVLHEAGLPPGVVNVVPGRGPEAGEALAAHPDVDMVSFTGSTAIGRHVGKLAADGIKKVALELGGKSANVILPGADLTKAVKVGVANAYLNSGQTCSAWTRMLVHADSYDEAVELAGKTAGGFTTGDPFDQNTRLGPLVNAKQRERVRGYIAAGQDEGAHLVTGGADAPQAAGYFVAPTVFAEVTPGMRIAQEEIFGPVLSILRYGDTDEALAIANGTPYGLAGGVWAADNDTAIAFARKLQTGQVDINGGRFNPVAPFGGYKQSGVGRELGKHGLAEFLQYKSLQF